MYQSLFFNQWSQHILAYTTIQIFIILHRLKKTNHGKHTEV